MWHGVSVLIPDDLAAKVTTIWGDLARRWLSELPDVIAYCTAAWQLTLGPAYPRSIHWVHAVTRADGTPAVLKLGPPEPGHLADEAAALRAFDGHGAVRLLASDTGRGALLLERADPGTPVARLVPGRDEDATAAVIGVLRRLHRPVPADCPLPDLRTLGRAFTAHLARYPGDRPLPRRPVQVAATLFDELCDSATGRVVLHGDLHHDNVLTADREPWLAIDPHGVVGDPGYDAGALLYNPDPDNRAPELTALVPRRLEQLADGLAMPGERILAWAYVKAVLSDVWTAESGPDMTSSRAWDVAEYLLPRLS